jgi:hypothetical protein
MSQARPSVDRAPVHAEPNAEQSSGCSNAAGALAKSIADALQRGETEVLSDQALEALMNALVRAYAAKIESQESQGRSAPRPPTPDLSPTDVMLVTRALLQSVGLSSFEYAFWQSWTGE